MPYIVSSYKKTQSYTPTNSLTPQPSIPELNGKVIYANVEDRKVEVGKIYSDIIYATSTEATTPRMIFDQIKKRAPEIVANCGIDDSVFLELLGSQIALFTSMGSHKWNFLTIEETLNLQIGTIEYPLPPNYDQMIAVWMDSNCGLNRLNRKVEIIQVDSEKQNFVSGFNYFSVKGGRLRFINVEDFSDTMYTGKIRLHFHINPQTPQSMEEEMKWFPANPKAIEYFKEKLMEDIYQRAGQAPYISQKAEIYFNDLSKWDHNFAPIQNKKATDMVVIDFTGMMSRRTGRHNY